MRTQRGFTLVELIVTVSILVILLGFITIGLDRSQQGASLASAQEELVTDLTQQQLKAMIGDTEGRSSSNSYGIHFDSNQYVIFHGATYSSSDSSNTIITLDNNLQFNNPNFDVIFSKLSGTTSARIIYMQEKNSSKLKQIHLNIFGVVNQVDSL